MTHEPSTTGAQPNCSHGCFEGDRQHVWDLHQGVRGGIVDGSARLGPPREPGPGGQPPARESVTLTRPKGGDGKR